jgi:hypothetical protein
VYSPLLSRREGTSWLCFSVYIINHCNFLCTYELKAKAFSSINIRNYSTTLSNGYLGSRIDEERSEMRYVMRIAEFSESSNL